MENKPLNIAVSLSGGVDSTTTLAIALDMVRNNPASGKVLAVSFDYGQRHSKELQVAAAIAGWYGIEHRILKMPSSHIQSALTDASQEIPKVAYDQIEGKSPAYVPFRNGLMLAMLAGLAASENYDIIMAGPHAEDAANWAYADCTMEFMGSMAAAIYVGTYNKVRLLTPLLYMTKTEVVQQGYYLGAPLEMTWSCYYGGEKHCGECPTCRARHQAFMEAEGQDPTEYESHH